MEKFFNNVEKKLKEYSNLGELILEDGTLLIGKAPHIAPKAWLHSIYPILTNEDLIALEDQIKIKIPDDYRIFLSQYSNGLNIFVDVFSLDGLRKKNDRTIQSAYQPYSIVNPNTKERISDAKDDMFFIGGYNWDGSLLYLQNEKAYRCSRDSTLALNTWNSFSEMLISEVDRICLVHDLFGVGKTDSPTIPF